MTEKNFHQIEMPKEVGEKIGGKVTEKKNFELKKNEDELEKNVVLQTGFDDLIKRTENQMMKDIYKQKLVDLKREMEALMIERSRLLNTILIEDGEEVESQDDKKEREAKELKKRTDAAQKKADKKKADEKKADEKKKQDEEDDRKKKEKEQKKLDDAKKEADKKKKRDREEEEEEKEKSKKKKEKEIVKSTVHAIPNLNSTQGARYKELQRLGKDGRSDEENKEYSRLKRLTAETVIVKKSSDKKEPEKKSEKPTPNLMPISGLKKKPEKKEPEKVVEKKEKSEKKEKKDKSEKSEKKEKKDKSEKPKSEKKEKKDKSEKKPTGRKPTAPKDLTEEEEEEFAVLRQIKASRHGWNDITKKRYDALHRKKTNYEKRHGLSKTGHPTAIFDKTVVPQDGPSQVVSPDTPKLVEVVLKETPVPIKIQKTPEKKFVNVFDDDIEVDTKKSTPQQAQPLSTPEKKETPPSLSTYLDDLMDKTPKKDKVVEKKKKTPSVEKKKDSKVDDEKKAPNPFKVFQSRWKKIGEFLNSDERLDEIYNDETYFTNSGDSDDDEEKNEVIEIIDAYSYSNEDDDEGASIPTLVKHGWESGGMFPPFFDEPAVWRFFDDVIAPLVEYAPSSLKVQFDELYSKHRKMYLTYDEAINKNEELGQGIGGEDEIGDNLQEREEGFQDTEANLDKILEDFNNLLSLVRSQELKIVDAIYAKYLTAKNDKKITEDKADTIESTEEEKTKEMEK
jgi:hypothetical protein